MRSRLGMIGGMINGTHVIVFSRDADADREFIRDVLGFAHVDAGHGWLIFKLPPAEIAVHPAEAPAHELYLMCDDLKATLAGLSAKGVEVPAEVTEQGWGTLATITLPSGSPLSLYEPHHPLAHSLDA
jgi:catechol 2,3-dioxygenase-like lactoylglutathione lyase family enzyme